MNEADPITLWGLQIPRESLTGEEARYLAGLPDEIPTNEWVWAEINRVWHEHGLDNRKPLAEQPIGAFYSHPVWLMNGAFSAVDPASAEHRRSIARFVASSEARKVADFGGGFGALATQIVAESPSTEVVLIEPYPSQAALARLADQPRISFTPEAEERAYDVVIAQDVLEHVEMPIVMAEKLARASRPGGILLFANNFTPVIQCHLPRTFHLHHTFRWVMLALGLEYRGRVEGAAHTHVYVVGEKLRPRSASAAATMSRLLAPLLNAASSLKKRLSPPKYDG